MSAPVSANIDKVAATSYYLISNDTGTVLAEKNSVRSVKPGDFSKLMTAYIAAKKLKMTDMIQFDSESLVFNNTFGNIISASDGMTISVKEHLYNMLLLYSDASANALAKKCSKNINSFVSEMNKEAEKMGMKNTVFSSPDGYDPKNVSKTDAKDLVVLSDKIMNTPVLKEIIKTDLFNISKNGKDVSYSSRNHLISKYTYSDYTYSAASGIMPAYSENGVNFIAYAQKDSISLTAIIIDSPNDKNQTVYRDAINILNYGFNNFYPVLICREGDITDQAKVTGGSSDSVILQCDKSVKAPLPYNYDKDKITFEISKTADVYSAPIKKGEKLGTITYFYDKKFVVTEDLVADKDIKLSFGGILRDTVFKKINTKILFFVILIIFIYIVVSSRNKEKKAKLAKKRKEIMENIDRQRGNKK